MKATILTRTKTRKTKYGTHKNPDLTIYNINGKSYKGTYKYDKDGKHCTALLEFPLTPEQREALKDAIFGAIERAQYHINIRGSVLTGAEWMDRKTWEERGVKANILDKEKDTIAEETITELEKVGVL